jgi:hypothetical protein
VQTRLRNKTLFASIIFFLLAIFFACYFFIKQKNEPTLTYKPKHKIVDFKNKDIRSDDKANFDNSKITQAEETKEINLNKKIVAGLSDELEMGIESSKDKSIKHDYERDKKAVVVDDKKTQKDKKMNEVSEVLPIILKNFTVNNEYEYGIWLWQSPLDLKGRNNVIIDQIALDKFNTVYVTIDDSLGFKNKQMYFDALSALISYANKKNIKIDVVAGAPDWSISKNHTKALAIIDFAVEYNDKYKSKKINKLQFDIVPYLLPGYERNKTEIFQDFIRLIDISVARILEKNNIGFSVVLPHFYDKEQNWTPIIDYNEKKNYVFDHVLGFLNKINNSAIIIMSYRNFFDGDNGVDAISRTEVVSGTNNTKIIIAQETGNILPPYTSFYGKTKEDLYYQLNIIQNEYEDFFGFGGIGIHYFKSFLEL